MGMWRPVLMAAMVVYFVALVLSAWLLSLDTLEQALARYALVVLPLGPAAVIVAVGVRRYQNLDELAQRIHLMAMSVAFLGTLMLVFTWTLLTMFRIVEDALNRPFGVSPTVEGLAVMGTLIVLYFLGWLLARRKYS